MKLLLTMCMMTFSLPALADVPRPRIEFASAYNGYATISGSLESAPTEPAGVTIQMSGFKYSTLTDSNGKWSVVIKYTSVNYSVESFSFLNPNDKSEEKVLSIK